MSLILILTALSLTTPLTRAAINFQPCPELNANITASNGFEGTPFDCATLEVPLDYTDPDSEPLALSLFRVNATQEPVLGTVLINFGGPGGTGAENLPAWADQAAANVGPQWNLLSWDPRGTGFTIPYNCNTSAIVTTPGSPTKKRDVEERQAEEGDLDTLVSANLTQIFLNGGWELAGAVADECLAQANETGTLIGTAFVARDMIEIVDALDEDGLLRYYGWSYGTALGSYVAAIFPERVERVVLDANVNPHDYAAGHYGEFLIDTDETFRGFLEACFNVTDACALYTLVQPNSTQDLLDALNLALAPAATNASASIEEYAPYLGLKAALFGPLYFPRQWPTLAATIAGLLNGTVHDPPATTASAQPYGAALDALTGIRASDATFKPNSSDEYLPQVEFQATVSPGFSDILYFGVWESARWRMPAKERYFGDFNVQTKFPILYVNGEFDPVTPLENAINGSATFEGSVVLPHNGYGHGVFVDPSTCVANQVQAYFSNGTLPDGNVQCESDATPSEIWLAVAQAAAGGSGSGSGSNGTDSGDGGTDDSTSDDSAGDGSANEQESEDAAGRQSTSVVFALAMVLMVASFDLL